MKECDDNQTARHHVNASAVRLQEAIEHLARIVVDRCEDSEDYNADAARQILNLMIEARNITL